MLLGSTFTIVIFISFIGIRDLKIAFLATTQAQQKYEAFTNTIENKKDVSKNAKELPS